MQGCLVTLASLLLVAKSAGAGTTGLAVTKTCPNTALQGDSVMCTVTVQNLDPAHGVSSLTVHNQVPFPGGSTVALSCDATSLSANGSLGDTTTCSAPETLNATCPAGSTITEVDRVMANATDQGVDVEGSVTNGIEVTCNTPTPTDTPAPTNTPTDTPPPTNTPTITPTRTITNTPPPTATPTNTQPVHVTGLSVSKTCPNSAQQGQTVHCTINISNLGGDPVSGLTVTDQVPFPGGSIEDVSGCASSLSSKGNAGDSTSCGVDETLNEPCPPGGVITVTDRVMAEAFDAERQLTVEGSVTNGITVVCKVGTPTVGWPGLGITLVLLVAAGLYLQYRSVTASKR